MHEAKVFDSNGKGGSVVVYVSIDSLKNPLALLVDKDTLKDFVFARQQVSFSIMSGANASPAGRSQEYMSGANASPTGRSQE